MMVDEGEWRTNGERMQPQSHLGEFDSHRILVHAVQAALSHQSASVKDLVLVRRDRHLDAVGVPGGDQGVAKLDEAMVAVERLLRS